MTLSRKRPRNTGPDQETTLTLYARAAARCELCHRDLSNTTEYSKHHRLPRGRSGTNDLANLLLLCGTGTTGCHGHVESHRTEAYDNGWLIRSGFAPAEVPVRIWDGSLVYLTSDGAYAEGSP